MNKDDLYYTIIIYTYPPDNEMHYIIRPFKIKHRAVSYLFQDIDAIRKNFQLKNTDINLKEGFVIRGKKIISYV